MMTTERDRRGAAEPGRSSVSGTSTRAGWVAGGIGLIGVVAAILAILVFDQPGIALVILVGMVALGIVGLILWSVVMGPGPHGNPWSHLALAAMWVGGAALLGLIIGNWTSALVMSSAAAVPLIFAVRAWRR